MKRIARSQHGFGPPLQQGFERDAIHLERREVGTSKSLALSGTGDVSVQETLITIARPEIRNIPGHIYLDMMGSK